ncbi:hypothetical protein Pint_14831 [Pistacia integerrima]|uniref:Uncharacterized protein n=1 Tax=Pistacia integerrima TaxID=434235 RepID=A0ACC0ZEN6_9ROSI|nr:hypothetical protein Pint_14831 [Pistacia integerrima]
MTSLTLRPLSSSTSTLFSLKKPPAASPLHLKHLFNNTHKTINKNKKVWRGICRAELSNDTPFVIAIGACMLSSLVLPTPTSEEGDADTALDSTDTRFAAMGIISFIPYFNWLSWVFAWLDTGKRRYAVYSIVYLIPYLRSNLSLSPEESWLPIASIIFCIVHVQLEASIRNGDIQGFQLFSQAEKHLSSMTKKKDSHMEGHQEISKEGRKGEDMNLPSAGEQSRNEFRQQGVPEKPSKHEELLNGDSDDDDKKREY